MNERLTATQIAILCSYALGMAAGQLLFKAAALRIGSSGSVPERIFALLHNWLFVLALVLYFALALVWVWILSFTPLSRAYLFVALAFALTPFAASLVFAEPLSARVLIGILVILFGLVLVSG
jgi:drug/metabolite transporter (DMT)-like permease